MPAGAIRKLDFERLPRHANLDAELTAKFAQCDPGSAHAVGYSWRTVGVGHDAKQPTQVQLPSAERLPLAVRPRNRSWNSCCDPTLPLATPATSAARA